MQWMSKSESLMSISNSVCINLFLLVLRASQKVWKMLGKASKNTCKTNDSDYEYDDVCIDDDDACNDDDEHDCIDYDRR